MNAHGSPYASDPHPPHRERVSRGANPLRRTSDKIETWFLRFLLLVLTLGLPMASISAGVTAYESSMRTVQAQTAQRQQVTARLTSDAGGGAGDGTRQAQIHWTDRNGKERSGTTLVRSGTPKGTTVRVWLDRDGIVTGPPMTEYNARTTGWFAGSSAAAGVFAGFLAARAGMRQVLDRRRYARWEAEWALVEPLWSARFRQ
ncbi:Rv1733c family protein [Streptomyces acidicola]|uniref:Rv1733c family protein n=1 Tax=Streptomyces acidicola TaxID=2596892 RepID=UPI003422A24D